MNNQTNFKTIHFSEDYSSATTPNGEKIKFTYFESRALRFFSKNPDRLVTRTQLLDAVSEVGSDKNDRNIDFLVNRIRKKLNDNVKEPRFIATRYGEGYIWVGRARASSIVSDDAYLVIGPIRGTDKPMNFQDLARPFSQALRKALKFQLPEGQSVIVDPDCPPASEFGEQAPEIGIDLTFFTESSVVECIVTVRKFRSGRIVAMTRIAVFDRKNQSSSGRFDAGHLAEWVLQEIWRARATISHSGDPLPVAIQTATQLKNKDPDARSWKKNDRWMRKLIAEHPDDPEIQLNYATHLQSKYVVSGFELFQKGIDDRKQDEDEIERLVQRALPHIQTNPELAIIAAKMLFFLGRGYGNFAVELAENAHKQSTVITHTLPIVGQMRGFLGNIDQGLDALDQAISLAERGTIAHLYSLVIKCNLQLAAGDLDGLTASKHDLYAQRPAIKFFLEPHYTDPLEPSFSARAGIMMLSRKAAAAKLLYTNYILSRLFQMSVHRENSIRTFLSLTIRRFDIQVVPTEIVVAFPNLMNAYEQ